MHSYSEGKSTLRGGGNVWKYQKTASHLIFSVFLVILYKLKT